MSSDVHAGSYEVKKPGKYASLWSRLIITNRTKWAGRLIGNEDHFLPHALKKCWLENKMIKYCLMNWEYELQLTLKAPLPVIFHIKCKNVSPPNGKLEPSCNNETNICRPINDRHVCHSKV